MVYGRQLRDREKRQREQRWESSREEERRREKKREEERRREKKRDILEEALQSQFGSTQVQ